MKIRMTLKQWIICIILALIFLFSMIYTAMNALPIQEYYYEEQQPTIVYPKPLVS